MSNPQRSPFRTEALREQAVLQAESRSLSEPARFAVSVVIVVAVAVVGSIVIGLSARVPFTVSGPAVLNRSGTMVTLVPDRYRDLLTPGRSATFEVEDSSSSLPFVTTSLREGPSDLTIVTAVPPGGNPTRGEVQYGRTVIMLGTEPLLARLVPAVESIVVPGM